MISFRARPEGAAEWTFITVSGDNAEVAAWAVATKLHECGWESLQAEGEELDWEDEDE